MSFFTFVVALGVWAASSWTERKVCLCVCLESHVKNERLFFERLQRFFFLPRLDSSWLARSCRLSSAETSSFKFQTSCRSDWLWTRVLESSRDGREAFISSLSCAIRCYSVQRPSFGSAMETVSYGNASSCTEPRIPLQGGLPGILVCISIGCSSCCSQREVGLQIHGSSPVLKMERSSLNGYTSGGVAFETHHC